jgi:5'(3')-deoxyribonucleotidase
LTFLKFFGIIYIENHSISIKEKQLLSVNIMVDDYLNNLNGERTYYSICLDYPWNQTDENISYFQRVKNWEEVVAAIDLYGNLREMT